MSDFEKEIAHAHIFLGQHSGSPEKVSKCSCGERVSSNIAFGLHLIAEAMKALETVTVWTVKSKHWEHTYFSREEAVSAFESSLDGNGINIHDTTITERSHKRSAVVSKEIKPHASN